MHFFTIQKKLIPHQILCSALHYHPYVAIILKNNKNSKPYSLKTEVDVTLAKQRNKLTWFKIKHLPIEKIIVLSMLPMQNVNGKQTWLQFYIYFFWKKQNHAFLRTPRCHAEEEKYHLSEIRRAYYKPFLKFTEECLMFHFCKVWNR